MSVRRSDNLGSRTVGQESVLFRGLGNFPARSSKAGRAPRRAQSPQPDGRTGVDCRGPRVRVRRGWSRQGRTEPAKPRGSSRTVRRCLLVAGLGDRKARRRLARDSSPRRVLRCQLSPVSPPPARCGWKRGRGLRELPAVDGALGPRRAPRELLHGSGSSRRLERDGPREAPV